MAACRSIPWAVYLEDDAPFQQIVERLVERHGMRRVGDRKEAGLVLVQESTAQRIFRTQARGDGFDEQARILYLPGMLYIEDKCKLAKLLRGAAYHPETYVDELPAGVVPAAGRWIEKLGLGANGANVRIVSPAPTSWSKKGHVLQRYEENVLLLDGRKFDLRVHAILLADGRFAIHDDAVVRRCAKQYTKHESDPASQITNMSVQRSYDSTLASVTSRLTLLPKSMQDGLRVAIQGTVADALHRFSAHVRSAEDAIGARMMTDVLCFRMLGLDILPMADGSVRLLEVNYRPAINTAGAVGPFYVDLIDWMVETLMRADTPQLTLPLGAPDRDAYALCPSILGHAPCLQTAVFTTRARAQHIVARRLIAGQSTQSSSATILMDAHAAMHFAKHAFAARPHPRVSSRILVPASCIRPLPERRAAPTRRHELEWTPTWIVVWPGTPRRPVAFTHMHTDASDPTLVVRRDEIVAAWFGCARTWRPHSAPDGIEFDADPRWNRGAMRSISTAALRRAAQALSSEPESLSSV